MPFPHTEESLAQKSYFLLANIPLLTRDGAKQLNSCSETNFFKAKEFWLSPETKSVLKFGFRHVRDQDVGYHADWLELESGQVVSVEVRPGINCNLKAIGFTHSIILKEPKYWSAHSADGRLGISF